MRPQSHGMSHEVLALILFPSSELVLAGTIDLYLLPTSSYLATKYDDDHHYQEQDEDDKAAA